VPLASKVTETYCVVIKLSHAVIKHSVFLWFTRWDAVIFLFTRWDAARRGEKSFVRSNCGKVTTLTVHSQPFELLERRRQKRRHQILLVFGFVQLCSIAARRGGTRWDAVIFLFTWWDAVIKTGSPGYKTESLGDKPSDWVGCGDKTESLGDKTGSPGDKTKWLGVTRDYKNVNFRDFAGDPVPLAFLGFVKETPSSLTLSNDTSY
jgi:hypothetical protein